LNTLGAGIREGDVILSNHPQAGGSHLPDLTVITPVCTTFNFYLFYLFTWFNNTAL